MEESYEYANEFGKQGRKNPRYIPKITINRELFSRAIEIKYTPTRKTQENTRNRFLKHT